MNFNRYYQDELTYLRELGEEFARENPKLAPFLGSQAGDPDVERLLEGFAFLTSRLRQKLDDEFPELSHSLIGLLWPHFLRPVPAMSIVQFTPLPHVLTGRQTVPKGVELDSRVVEGTACRFQTCFDVELFPLALTAAELQESAVGTVLKLRIELLGGVSLPKLELRSLRLHLCGQPATAMNLYLWLTRHVRDIQVKALEGAESFGLSPAQVQAVGFRPEEGLLPYHDSTFMGYRLLQEYYALPEKFLFLDIGGLEPVAEFGVDSGFELVFHLTRPWEEGLRPKSENFRLFCSPVVNLHKRDAEPIRLDHKQSEYRLRPAADNPAHYEIYSVDRVQAWVQGSGERYEYLPFESFDFEKSTDSGSRYYRTQVKPAVTRRGVETYLSFSATEHSRTAASESVAVELTCTNHSLPDTLRAGDINMATASTPPFVSFTNISRVTTSLAPPLEGGLQWRLISNMALNYSSLASVEALRVVLDAYDLRARLDRQARRVSQRRLEGIAAVDVRAIERFHRGLPVRGLHTRLDVRESCFGGEGDLYLFATVLNEFFSLFARINSFHQLTVQGMENGEIYEWPAKIGQQALL